MGVRIGDVTGRFELMNRTDPPAGRVRQRFMDEDEALRFLRRQLVSDDRVAAVRRAVHALGIDHPTHRMFLQRLAAAILAGDVWVGERPQASLMSGGGGAEVDPDKPGRKPGRKPKPVAELVVFVKDLDRKPVAGAKVTAGALGSMTANDEGIADFGTVTPGTYDITAEKPGHGRTRNGPEEKDEKTSVAVPDGSRTEVELIQHPECANVAFFEGATTRSKYFGFDHKTNIKAAPNGEYWVPVPEKSEKLEVPTDKLTQDEARWVSVAVGQETELEIHFAFKGTECIPCIANSTFEVIPANVAEVVTAKITAKKAAFKIKGKAKGEASLKVVCDGRDIGWFHIWCEVEKELLIDVATLVTTRTTAAVYDNAAMRDHLNDVFRQAMIKLNLKDLGTIDLSANAPLALTESACYPSVKFQDGSTDAQDTAFLTAADMAAMAVVAARTTGASGRAGARRLYWYVPTAGAKWGGMNLNIGHPATFIFFSDGPAARNTGAHEIGHSLGLRHPSDGSGASQFAPHNLSTCNAATPAYAATNTEPASDTNPAHDNIMANDPTNLMGYWPVKAARKYLRYHQWQAAARS